MTDTEAFLVRVCREKLGVDALEPENDLRRLGADSLFLVELAVEIEDAFGIEVPAEAIEEDARVSRIAAWIDERRPHAAAPQR
jgi:acyl carrier protein